MSHRRIRIFCSIALLLVGGVAFGVWLAAMEPVDWALTGIGSCTCGHSMEHAVRVSTSASNENTTATTSTSGVSTEQDNASKALAADTEETSDWNTLFKNLGQMQKRAQAQMDGSVDSKCMPTIAIPEDLPRTLCKLERILEQQAKAAPEPDTNGQNDSQLLTRVRDAIQFLEHLPRN